MSGKLTRTSLEALDPAILGQIAKGMRATAQEYETEQSQFPGKLRHPGGGEEWTGQASDALQEHGAVPMGRTYGSLHDHLNDTAAQADAGEGLISSSRDTARQFIAGVEAKSAVLGNDSIGIWDCGEPFTVADDFAVSVKPGSVPAGAPPQIGQVLQLMAYEYTQDTQRLVAQLEELGQTYATKIQTALDVSHLALDSKGHSYSPYDPRKPISDMAKGIADGTIPVPKDPNVLRDLWSKLNETEKNNIYNRYHDIGNHGGIPIDPPDHLGRDHYNKENLKRIRAEKQAQLEELNRHTPDWGPDNLPMGSASYQDWKKKTEELKHQIDGLDNVKWTIDNSKPPRFLTVIDDKGHAAVAIKNPDYAKKVDTFVPGTGQDLSRMNISDGHAQDMYRTARQMDQSLGPGDVSVTTWMGYDRPMTVFDPLTGAGDGSSQWAGREKFALDGAQPLVDYQNGIRASHDDLAAGGRAYQTVIGHSYGSSVVGAAATGGHHLDADAVIEVGSPGAFAESASGLSLNPNARVFDALAKNDIIKAANAGDSIGVHPLGKDPHDWPDVTKFKTDPGPDGYGTGLSIDAHSSYFNQGGEGLKNIGKIIDGQEPEHEK